MLTFDAHGYPTFFAAIAPIILYDPLAALLGAAHEGKMTYHYADAVRLAGHSCPTVAAAWGLSVRALRTLYGKDMPQRGGVDVQFAQAQEAGVTGVIASVAGLLTGAAGSGGFKGIAGQFARNHRISFEAPISFDMRFSRRDTGASVDARADLSRVPADPRTSSLLQRILAGENAPLLQAEFAELWQERVRSILIDHADDPELFIVRDQASH